MHEKYSASSDIKGMQIKTTLRFPITLVRMAIIKKANNSSWMWWLEPVMLAT
jgi:hypothetical protein